MLKALWLWLLLINGTAFALCGVDKWKVVQGQWRVRERTLLLAAALGGSPGLLLAMLFFHHKTRHRKFTWVYRLFWFCRLPFWCGWLFSGAAFEAGKQGGKLFGKVDQAGAGSAFVVCYGAWLCPMD